MADIKLNLGKRAYNIIIGERIILKAGSYIKKLKLGTDGYVITNPFLKEEFGGMLVKGMKSFGFKLKFRIIPDSEKSKSTSTAFSTIKDLASFAKKKQAFIIAFGGGVVGDLSGFIASIYKRGIPYINIPTTLLAQVDSGIGGKTAVDLKEGKNLVGAFYQPRLVLSDINFLKSLDQKQLRSGLSEVIKYGLICDAELFCYLEKHFNDILKRDSNALGYIVKKCSAIKAKIVEADEREETGLRTILNFGHTIGHAIEAAGRYKGYTHGEAIALGMLVASEISSALGLLDRDSVKRIERLIQAAGLPVKIKRLNFDKIIDASYHDKKFTGKTNRFVLLKGIGHALVARNINFKVVKEALRKRF